MNLKQLEKLFNSNEENIKLGFNIVQTVNKDNVIAALAIMLQTGANKKIPLLIEDSIKLIISKDIDNLRQYTFTDLFKLATSNYISEDNLHYAEKYYIQVIKTMVLNSRNTLENDNIHINND